MLLNQNWHFNLLIRLFNNIQVNATRHSNLAARTVANVSTWDFVATDCQIVSTSRTRLDARMVRSKTDQIGFLKMGHSRPLFLYFSLFNTVDSKQMFNKFCWWLDSNCWPLVLEATALPTEPHNHCPYSDSSPHQWVFSGCRFSNWPVQRMRNCSNFLFIPYFLQVFGDQISIIFKAHSG